MISKLTALDSEFAKKLLFALKCRIIERRQKVAGTLLAYLEDPRFIDSTSSLHLDYANRDEIAKKATDLFIRLFPPPVTETDCTESDPDEPEMVEVETIESATPPKKSDSGEWRDFEDCLKPKMPVPRAAKSVLPADVIKQGMESFEIDGERPSSLEKASWGFLCKLNRRISRFFFNYHKYILFSQVYNALLSVPATSCEAERSVI